MTIQVDAILDIETESWDTYVLGAIYDSDRQYHETRDPSELFDFLLTSGHVWAHNGGKFDTLWALDLARDWGIHCVATLAGSRITSVRIGDSCELHDSYAMLPVSLAKLGALCGADKGKQKFPWSCRCEHRDCGGYCRIERSMPESMYHQLGDYLRADCETLYQVLDAWIAECDECGYDLRRTIGSTAWATAVQVCDLKPATWESSRDYELARAGAYGGRVHVFRPRADTGYRYDIHSSYPAALMRQEVPTGDPILLEGDRAGKAYARGLAGCYEATVSVAGDDYMPPLPSRRADGRVCYPIGEVRGVWTAIELGAAERAGATIQTVHGGIAWLESLSIAPFVDRVCSRRAEYLAADDPRSATMAKLHKLVGNSLTGKFAQRPESRRIVISPDPREIKVCPGGEHAGSCSPYRCCDHECSGRCGRWELLGRDVWSAPYWRIADCGHVQWYAYLTASARGALLDHLRDAGESAVYCDTDSVYRLDTPGPTIPLGDDLGEWGLEGTMTDFRAIAPKLYRYSDQDGAPVVKSKGLGRLSPEDFNRVAAGEAVELSGVESLLTAVRGEQLFIRRQLTRQNRSTPGVYGDRVLRGDRTYPIEMERDK